MCEFRGGVTDSRADKHKTERPHGSGAGAGPPPQAGELIRIRSRAERGAVKDAPRLSPTWSRIRSKTQGRQRPHQ